MEENEKEESVEEKERKPIIIRNSTDLQRVKLEKLMKNPDKPVIIPEKPKERGVPNVPDFVRNVMGSSAGAGSGEFHVYRHLRRKEYARQKYMKEIAERERLEEDYHKKIEENKKRAEERTEKKRLKRQKKKQKLKEKAKKSKSNEHLDKSSSSSEQSSSEEESTTENKEGDISSSERDDRITKSNKLENENSYISKNNEEQSNV